MNLLDNPIVSLSPGFSDSFVIISLGPSLIYGYGDGPGDGVGDGYGGGPGDGVGDGMGSGLGFDDGDVFNLGSGYSAAKFKSFKIREMF